MIIVFLPDIEEEDLPKSVQSISMAEMEAAVMLQDLLMAKEQRALARVAEANSGTAAEEGQGTEKKVSYMEDQILRLK